MGVLISQREFHLQEHIYAERTIKIQKSGFHFLGGEITSSLLFLYEVHDLRFFLIVYNCRARIT